MSRRTLVSVKKPIELAIVFVDCKEELYVNSVHKIMWSPKYFDFHRNHLPPKIQCAVNRDVVRYPGPALNQTQRGGRPVRQTTDTDALEKITVLESELLKLRAQIAMIVTAAPASGSHSFYHVTQKCSACYAVLSQAYLITLLCFFNILLGPIESQNAPGTPLMYPPPRPALTSTPRCAAPPPPPPPPPPPCPSSSTETSSVLQLIRQRRKDEKDLDKGQGLEVKGIPSMLDVLKDLNQVKLRSVER